MEEHKDGLWKGGDWERSDPDALARALDYQKLNTVTVTEEPTGLRPRRRRRRWPWYAWLFIALFIVGVVGTAIQWAVDYSRPPMLPPPPHSDEEGPQFHMNEEERSHVPPHIPHAPTGTGVTLKLHPQGDLEPLTYTELYDLVSPSMVSIECYQEKTMSTGTGVIFTSDGYIVTNAHVVAEADAVRVFLHNNQALDAELVGFDANEDLAVLKIDAQGLTPAQFGDSYQLRCGDPVAALGDPLGYRGTITDGIVSALDREIDMGQSIMALIQTNAAINFGNSGGALVNQYGQVVGITTIKIVSNDGSAEALGFAIPSRRVKYVADSLIAGEVVRAGVLGVTVSTYAAPGGGLYVMEVSGWSDAARQGVQKDDVILAADGRPVNATQDLTRIKQEKGVGDTVTLTVLRDGKTLDIEFELVEAP